MKLSVGIIGVTGYTGQELLRILSRHPGVCLGYLASRQLSAAQPIGDLLPAFRYLKTIPIHPFNMDDAVDACDLLFLALPHGVAMGLAAGILRKKGKRVIDLSADFRFQTASGFFRAYGLRHRQSRLLRQAVYGLTEYAREVLPSARLVANPGCYPTAVLLAALPLAQAGLLKKEGLIADAKSGISGAGRGLKEELLFCEANEDLRAYRVNTHQHIPEMQESLRLLSGATVPVLFVPHLVPMSRGLYATLYAPLARPMSERKIRSLLEQRYEGEPFIRVLPEGKFPQVKSVAGTNGCEIGLRVDQKRQMAILLCAIDNLGKGAAGQAVQNMNRMYGFEETEGLSA